MKLQALILTVIVAAAPSVSRAGTDSIPQQETDAIVLKFQAAYADTFNRRDAKGMAALLTENATLQNEWGDVTQGRTKIELLLTQLMANLQTGTKLEDTSLASQSIAADIIVSQGISRRIVPARTRRRCSLPGAGAPGRAMEIGGHPDCQALDNA